MENLACKLLKSYAVAENLSTEEINNFKTFKSNLLGMQNIYSFEFSGVKYYATDDYTLGDNPEDIKRVLEEINPNITGEPLKNPIPQSDGAIYACSIDGAEYYLWQTND